MAGPSVFTRRRLLGGIASLVTAGSVAGCSETPDGPDATGDRTDTTDDPESEPGGRDTAEPEGRGSPTESPDAAGTGSPDGEPTETPEESDAAGADLDLREANVVEVSFEGEEGSYDFDVTLYHDDDGEDGYADHWQVESLDGTRLGRRELLHAHSTSPFTRSETIEVPDDVDCVVVRGHDQTHGYGGQAMLSNLASGDTAADDQGEDSRSFAEADCP